MTTYTKISVKGNDTYFHLSDGMHILYCEKQPYSEKYKMTTVHQPNQKVGTGFQIDDYATLDAETVNKYLPIILPNWAHESEYKHVKKYPNLESYLDYERKFWGDKLVVEEITLN